MARRNRRRVTSANANSQLPFGNSYKDFLSRPIPPLSLFEDRRRFHPEGIYAPPMSFNTFRVRLHIPKRPRRLVKVSRSPRPVKFANVAPQLAFQFPVKVLICARRKIRKSVLFAKRKTGKSGQRRPHFNYYSSVKC